MGSHARLLATPLAALVAVALAGTAGAEAVTHHAAAVSSTRAAAPAAAAANPAATPKSCQISNAAAKKSSKPPRVLKSHAYFGGFALGDGASSTDTAGSFQVLENKACRRLDIAHAYVNWSHNFPPDRFTTQAAQQGKVILLSWTGTDTVTMNSGKVDNRIRQIADEVKSFGYPVLFEYRWEMDIPNNAGEVHSAQDYIAAYDRVHRIFGQQGVKNASFVWCPSGIGFYEGWAQKYYPGNSVVDWVCSDVYIDTRFGKPETAYQSPSLLTHAFLVWRHHHRSKPALIGEFGIPVTWSNAWRAKWFKQMRTYVKAHKGIRGVVVFDHKPAGQPESHDVSLGSNPQVVAAFQSFTMDPYFRPKDRADPNP